MKQLYQLVNMHQFQNPFRRPIASLAFIVGFFFAVWFGIGACLPIDKAVSLGFW
jgi:cytochrome b6-f complex subunit 4